jgi:hypothetical protein
VSEHALPPASRTALKEWAVACEALGRGEQVLLLRKGGISEEGRAFRIEHPEFLLFPTFEHQRPDLLKEPAQPALANVLATRGSTETIPLKFWAIVAEVFEVTEPEQLAAVTDLHIWSDEYALSRLRWKPRQPLQLLALRVYSLPTTVKLPARPEYGGCKSWLTLAEPIVVEGARPVLDDERFAERVSSIRRALGRAAGEVPTR